MDVYSWFKIIKTHVIFISPDLKYEMGREAYMMKRLSFILYNNSVGTDKYENM